MEVPCLGLGERSAKVILFWLRMAVSGRKKFGQSPFVRISVHSNRSPLVPVANPFQK